MIISYREAFLVKKPKNNPMGNWEIVKDFNDDYPNRKLPDRAQANFISIRRYYSEGDILIFLRKDANLSWKDRYRYYYDETRNVLFYLEKQELDMLEKENLLNTLLSFMSDAPLEDNELIMRDGQILDQ